MNKLGINLLPHTIRDNFNTWEN